MQGVEAAVYEHGRGKNYARSAEAAVYVSMERKNLGVRRQAVYVSMAGRRSTARSGGSGICEHGRRGDTGSVEAAVYVSMAGRRVCARSAEQQSMWSMAGRRVARSAGSSFVSMAGKKK
jgi:hypothetical protein